MSYPGNPSLPPDVQGRLLETFTQTLDLAAAGSAQEALLGCDFLLRMDPSFEPARVLMERLNAWRGPGGPDVADLRLDPPAAGAAEAVSPPPVVRIPAGQAAPAPGAEVSFADLSLPDGDSEAAPYVARYLRDARAALQGGRREEAERLLVKARALDESNPEVARLARELAAPASPAPEIDADFLTDATSFAEISDLGRAPAARLGSPLGAAAAAAAAPEPDADASQAGEDPRIAELLAAGEAAFERGEHQNAIDAWSRVFLIDIDHAQAGRRIEEARRFKAEAERKSEELFQDALTRYEEGDRDGAREIFARLLAANPNHLPAREMMERIEAGGTDEVGAPPRRGRVAATSAAAELGAAVGKVKSAGKGVLKDEIMVPPEPGERREDAAPVEAGRAGRPSRGGRRGLILAAAALVLVVAAGGWLWTQRDRLFPNRGDSTAVSPVSVDPLERAKRLHAEGRTSAAVAQLRRLTADDPLYQGAQALIAQWEALERPAASAPPGLEPEKAERRDRLLAAARQAVADRRYVIAGDWLRQAAEIAPLDGESVELDRQARAAIAPYQAQLGLFRQGEWEAVLPSLWRLREADPQNRDVTGMIVDSYFNLGVRELQREAPDAAADKFREAINLAPDDRELRRAASFAEAYRTNSFDLQYKIFVKYLPFRSGAAA